MNLAIGTSTPEPSACVDVARKYAFFASRPVTAAWMMSSKPWLLIVAFAPTRTVRLSSHIVAELRLLRVDVIVTLGGPAAAAAKEASSAIPVIVVNAGDVVESGLVSSLAHPHGNLTGISDQSEVLSGKRLELLKEMVPAATRVAVLWNADDRAMTLRYRAIEKAAQVLRVSILPLGVREPDDFDAALKAMGKWRPDALMMVSDSLTNLNRQRVIDYAAAQRIPAMYEFGALVQGGGLMSYGTTIWRSTRRRRKRSVSRSRDPCWCGRTKSSRGAPDQPGIHRRPGNMR